MALAAVVVAATELGKTLREPLVLMLRSDRPRSGADAFGTAAYRCCQAEVSVRTTGAVPSRLQPLGMRLSSGVCIARPVSYPYLPRQQSNCMSESSTPISAVRRIAEISNQLVQGQPHARELVAELFQLFASVLREEAQPIDQPKPMDCAPREARRKLLLYCPNQDGWQVGEWLEGRWMSMWHLDFLEPTHWTEIPNPPSE